MAVSDQNPYATPSADLKTSSLPPGSPVKAILLGIAVDLGGSMVLGVVFGMIYATSLAAEGLSGDEIASRLQSIPLDSWYHILALSLGLVLSVVGGYVCARIAKHNEYMLGAIQAAILITFGVAMGGGTYPVPVHALLAVLSAVAVIGGVWLGVQKNEALRNEAQRSQAPTS
jgi:hypothetical protein